MIIAVIIVVIAVSAVVGSKTKSSGDGFKTGTFSNDGVPASNVQIVAPGRNGKLEEFRIHCEGTARNVNCTPR